MVKFFFEVYCRARTLQRMDRIGPDVFVTHWMLHFKSTMLKLCKKKFRTFDTSSELRPYSYIEAPSKIDIGKNVVIRSGTYLFADPRDDAGEIIIEDDVLLGSGVHIYVNKHRFVDTDIPIMFQGYPDPRKSDTVILRRGCWIGANATILPGVVIGETSVVAATAVVTQSHGDRVLVAGVPARVIKSL